ncbi:MAG TPA: gamma-glutamyltransferase [Planctomycetota bacterium]|nr:gamma-glutamyltransferase [Planctomycetota bacterium]
MAAHRGALTGVVVAPQAEAAYEGARVLSDGGNAADALVTAAFVQGVVDPHRSGMGGFGCSTVFFPMRGPPLSIDFHGRAGRLSRPDEWADIFESAAPDGFGYVVKGKVNDVGYRSITVPGMVAGIGEIHQQFGTLPWRDLVLRAARYAEEGFLVTPDLAEFWIRPGLHGRVSTRDRLSHTETGKSICLKENGDTFKAGDLFRQPMLARTYGRLAEEGPESFYRGPLGDEIANDWSRGGALVTREDLRAYRPEPRDPLSGSYRGLRLFTTPLPGGGVALLQALGILEKLSPHTLAHNSPAYIDRVAPVLSAVWADRLRNHGDPGFGGLSTAELLAPRYLEGLRGAPDVPSGADSESTTQLTIVDGHGNAVAFSHSLGYGSGVFTPGMGFMYNNCMSAFDPRPGRRNSMAPGKARITAVAETLLFEGKRLRLVLGSPGAARITAALVQTILNVVDFGMTAPEAVVHPRFDAYGERKLILESRFPRPLVEDLRRRGWDIVQSPKPFGVVGRVYAVEMDPVARRAPLAAVDPGEPGAAYRGTPEEEDST